MQFSIHFLFTESILCVKQLNTTADSQPSSSVCVRHLVVHDCIWERSHVAVDISFSPGVLVHDRMRYFVVNSQPPLSTVSYCKTYLYCRMLRVTACK